MPDLKNHPPMPKWHGTPPDLVDKYLVFKRNLIEAESQTRRQELEETIASYERSKADRLRSIGALRATIADQRSRLTALQGRLIDTTDLSRFDDGLLGLMDHPAVIGLRVASNGRIIIHIRVTKKVDEEEDFVGHFEIDPLFDTIDTLTDSLKITQTDVTDDRRWSSAFSWGRQTDGLISGTLAARHMCFQLFLERGELVELVDATIAQLCQRGMTKRQLQLDTTEPIPTWSGICPGVEYALARTLEWSINRPLRKKIKDAESELASSKTSAKEHSDRLREINQILTSKRAELVDLNKAIQEGTFDENAAREELLYITTLPGVMGIKFETIDQKPVPLVHVRASLVRQGRRYDMGDYEFVLRRHSYESAAVIETRLTRQSRRAVLYYHETSRYEGMSWFCFGSRARDLSANFLRGDIGSFLHVAIDSLNSLNPGDLDYYNLEEYFTRIDEDAVWNAQTPNTRPRRRRWMERLSEVAF